MTSTVWTDDILDVEDWKEQRALQKGQLDAIRRSRQFGTKFCISRNGQLVALNEPALLKLEQEVAINLNRLNQKIAELEEMPAADFMLNDAPAQKPHFK